MAEGYVEHVFLLVGRKHSMREWVLVIDEFESLVELHGFWDEENLEGVEETFDDALLVYVSTSVYFRPTKSKLSNIRLLTHSRDQYVGPSSVFRQTTRRFPYTRSTPCFAQSQISL